MKESFSIHEKTSERSVTGKKPDYRSEYSKANTEEARLTLLGYRDDLMCRQIVMSNKWVQIRKC